jgi:hypothetical protein
MMACGIPTPQPILNQIVLTRCRAWHTFCYTSWEDARLAARDAPRRMYVCTQAGF